MRKALLAVAVAAAIAVAWFVMRPKPSVPVATYMEHVKGNGSIEIVEFSDFQCPACKSAYPMLKELLDRYDGRIRLRYRHFPLPFHSNAMPAAEAAECAAEEGKFWEYHDILFERQEEWTRNRKKLYDYAEELGINMTFFRLCMDSHATRPRIETNIREGRKLGIRGTPTFIINGRQVYANQLEREIQRVLEG